MRSQPPGPNGMPFLGNSHQYAEDPFAFMSACAEAYGDVVQFDLGPQPVYMLTNPLDIERVLVSESSAFPKLDLGDDAITKLLGDGLLMSEGEAWKQQRQRANPAFHSRRINTLAGMMTDHTEELLADWQDGDRIDIPSGSRISRHISNPWGPGSNPTRSGGSSLTGHRPRRTGSSPPPSRHSKQLSTRSSPSVAAPKQGEKTSRWICSRSCSGPSATVSRPTPTSATR